MIFNIFHNLLRNIPDVLNNSRTHLVANMSKKFESIIKIAQMNNVFRATSPAETKHRI